MAQAQLDEFLRWHLQGYYDAVGNVDWKYKQKTFAASRGYVAGWEMGHCPHPQSGSYKDQTDYWAIWNKGVEAQQQGRIYQNPYPYTGWSSRWRYSAYLAGVRAVQFLQD